LLWIDDGAALGKNVGPAVGLVVGSGLPVGLKEGSLVIVGESLGEKVGLLVVGGSLGTKDGKTDRLLLGSQDGVADGTSLGT
jgi:hypothetical protein